MSRERRRETNKYRALTQAKPLAPAVEISNCCKAPVWKEKGTDRPICDKCRGGCKPILVASPEPPPALPHDPCIDSGCPGYDPGIMPTCVEEVREGPYSLPLRSGQPAHLHHAGRSSKDWIRFEIPPLPETFDADAIKEWFMKIQVKSPGGMILFLKENRWDVEQRS